MVALNNIQEVNNISENQSIIKKRFLFKLIRSSVGAGFAIITLPLVTRSLGAEQYGTFNYLKVFFEKIIGFLDVGTSGFYPKLSRRPSDKGIIRFVLIYDAILFLATIMMLGVLFLTGLAESVLTIQSFAIAFSALLLAWLLLVNQKMTSFMDALGKTISNEMILMAMRLALTIGLVLLFISKKLNLTTFLQFQNVVLIFFLSILLLLAIKYFDKENKSTSIKETAQEFKAYSLPLFWASTLGLIAGIADRWLLQVFGGATAQGFYSLGLNLGAICFLITGSLTPLLMREYAIAHEKNDKDRLRYLFSKYLPLFFVITATIACFLAVHGDWLAPLVGGGEFSEAAVPVMLLGLAPIHQTYGQLSGSLMTATDRTREYAGISMFMLILSLPITYFTLAPEQYWGLNLGATGLALKLVVLQIIAVNLQIWYNTRYLGIGMVGFITHQMLIVTVFLLFAFVTKFLVGIVLGSGIVGMIISSLLYIGLIAVLVFIFPQLISMTRSEMIYHIKAGLAFLR